MQDAQKRDRGGRPRTRGGAIRNSLEFWRDERGMTQTAVAAAAGVRQDRLSRFESGDSAPTMEELAALTKVLRVSFADLYSEDMLRVIRASAEAAS